MKFNDIKLKLLVSPKTWLVTGVAGFIGSNLLEALLLLDQPVVGLGYKPQYNMNDGLKELLR